MDHQFLELGPRCAGETAARSVVYQQLEVVLGKRLPDLGPADPIPLPGRPALPPFRVLVGMVKETGVPGPLQEIIDMSDPVLGGVEFTATNSEVMNWTINIGDTSRRVPGPGYVAQACGELAEDILAYRRQVCAASNRSDIGWTEIGRSFRGLLFASSALVEAYLNRHLLAARLGGIDTTKVEAITTFRVRATAWIELFSPGSSSVVKRGRAWSQHMELRHERNEIGHAREPSLGVSLPNLPRWLNAVREGVGGLICHLQRLRKGPMLGFMLKLQQAPEARFVSYRAKEAARGEDAPA